MASTRRASHEEGIGEQRHEPNPSVATSWGTTAVERALPYPCDRFLAEPDAALYRGVSVEARPEHAFRWLCQLRVAPYSYDWIDNLGRKSPRHLISGIESLAVGQRFMTIFTLVDFAPDVHLTLRMRRGGFATRAFGDVVVTYLVAPQRDDSCRLLAKVLVRYPRGPLGPLVRQLLPWGDLVMMRRQLLNLKALAEGSSGA